MNNPLKYAIKKTKKKCKNKSKKENNKLKNNDYKLKNIICSIHSKFYNLEYGEIFKHLFNKRDEEYFKIIINKVLNNEYEDVKIIRMDNKAFNMDGNHRIMIAKLLNYYKLYKIKKIKVNKMEVLINIKN
jgi:hypothetical protein